MSQQLVNVGAAPNDGTGDPLRDSFVKLNANDTELYAFKGAVDASNGLIARTGAGAFSARTLTAGSTKIVVTNGDGVAGNPTIDVGTVPVGSISGLGTLATQNGTFSGTSSGTNTGDQTSVTGNAGTATKLATARTIAITGDLSYTSPSFDGSANVTAAGTLATVNPNVGSFGASNAIPVITVDAKGRITAVTTAPAPLTFSGAGISHTGDTTETTLATIAIPANSMGPNGWIEITALVEATGSNTKTWQFRFGGTSFTSYSTTTGIGGRVCAVIHANGATNSQSCWPVGSFGVNTSANVTGSVDTTASQNITLTGQLTNTGESIKLDRYTVKVFYGA